MPFASTPIRMTRSEFARYTQYVEWMQQSQSEFEVDYWFEKAMDIAVQAKAREGRR